MNKAEEKKTEELKKRLYEKHGKGKVSKDRENKMIKQLQYEAILRYIKKVEMVCKRAREELLYGADVIDAKKDFELSLKGIITEMNTDYDWSKKA